jgi:hypothetical protein
MSPAGKWNFRGCQKSREARPAAASAPRAGRFLCSNGTSTRWLDRSVDALSIALGARLALSAQRYHRSFATAHLIVR